MSQDNEEEERRRASPATRIQDDGSVPPPREINPRVQIAMRPTYFVYVTYRQTMKNRASKIKMAYTRPQEFEGYKELEDCLYQFAENVIDKMKLSDRISSHVPTLFFTTFQDHHSNRPMRRMTLVRDWENFAAYVYKIEIRWSPAFSDREWKCLPQSIIDQIFVRFNIRFLRRVIGLNEARNLLFTSSLPGSLVQYDCDNGGMLLCEIFKYCHDTSWIGVRRVELSLSQDRETIVGLIGSAKGVVCCRLYREGGNDISFHLLNPVIREVRDIAFPTIQQVEWGSVLYEFGYDLAGREFKIVRIIHLPVARIEIFRSSRNEWAELNIPWPTVHGTALMMNRSPSSIFFQGRKFLFFGHPYNEYSPEAIVGFHIGNEIFDIVKHFNPIAIDQEPILELMEKDKLKLTIFDEHQDVYFSWDLDVVQELWYPSQVPHCIPAALGAILRNDLPRRDMIKHTETLQWL